MQTRHFTALINMYLSQSSQKSWNCSDISVGWRIDDYWRLWCMEWYKVTGLAEDCKEDGLMSDVRDWRGYILSQAVRLVWWLTEMDVGEPLASMAHTGHEFTEDDYHIITKLKFLFNVQTSYCNSNKAIVESRLRPHSPGWVTLSTCTIIVAFAWPIMGKHDVIDKTGST